MKRLTREWLLFPSRPILSITLLGLTTVTGALLATHETTHAKPAEVISSLTALQTQLTSLANAINKPSFDVNVDGISQQIAGLSVRLNQLRAVDPEQLNQTINHTETVLSGQLNSIQTTVNHLDEKAMPVKYLKPENLPFNVVSLDSIQQIPVASIAYDFKVIPLEKGDVMAGWTLIQLDYGKQRLEFENAKKERVLITHEQIG